MKPKPDKLQPLLAFISTTLRSNVAGKLQNHHDTEDLLQDVYERVYARRAIFENLPPNEQQMLVRTFAKNLAVDVFRRRNRKRTVQLTSCIASEKPRVFAQMELENVTAILQNSVTGPQLLEYVQGYKVKEIATAHNISINTALGRNRYARIHLKKHYQQ